MSEKNAPKMFGGKDVADGFYETLAGSLEGLMAGNDAASCLELVKFLRRFSQDVPISDYRTVGYPTAIQAFLDACGLTSGKDYEIEASTLDPSSHVVKFTATDNTRVLLGCVAGLRVDKGPSVCDRLYCEMCKDKGRDFLAVLKSRGTSGARRFKDYVLSRTADVYAALSEERRKRDKATADGTYKPSQDADDEVEDGRVLAFAESQLSEGKLRPTAIPVVPLAVAELYARLTRKKDDKDVTPPLFALGERPGEWTSARSVGFSGAAPSYDAACTPLPLLRMVLPAFDQYMPTDAFTFESAGRSDDSVSFVAAGAPLRFPGHDAESTVRKFNAIEARQTLFRYVEECYRACYPSLRLSFYNGSSVHAPVCGKYVPSAAESDTKVGKLVREADAALGIGKGDAGPYGLVVTAAFLMAPFQSLYDHGMFECGKPTPVILRRAEKETKKRKGSECNMAEAWFRTVHNVPAPGFTEAEAAEKMEAFLTESVAKTESGCVPDAIAVAVRGAIVRAKERSGSLRIRALDVNLPLEGASEGGLHDPGKTITQLVTTVSGPSSRTFTQFMREVESGKVTTAPLFPSVAYMLPRTNPEAVSFFMAAADSSGLQTRMPRKIGDFAIYAETNLSYDALSDLHENTCGFYNNMLTRLHDELTSVLIGKFTPATGFERTAAILGRRPRLVKALGALNPVVRRLDSLASGERTSTYNVCIEHDREGRAVIAIRVDTATAFLAMFAKASDDELDGLLQAAAKHDPATLTITDENWVEELCDHLLSGAVHGASGTCFRGASHSVMSALLANCPDERHENGYIRSDVSVTGMFNKSVVSAEFAYLKSVASGGIDPN